MQVHVNVVGVDRTRLRLERFPAAARKHIDDATKRLGYLLEGRIKTVELAGRSLHRRSGTLARSVNTRFTFTANESSASVGSNVFYGRIWEVTGTQAYTIVAKTRKALFWAGAAHPVRSVHRPAVGPKPWLRPALAATRPTIREQYAQAISLAASEAQG